MGAPGWMGWNEKTLLCEEDRKMRRGGKKAGLGKSVSRVMEEDEKESEWIIYKMSQKGADRPKVCVWMQDKLNKEGEIVPNTVGMGSWEESVCYCSSRVQFSSVGSGMKWSCRGGPEDRRDMWRRGLRRDRMSSREAVEPVLTCW